MSDPRNKGAYILVRVLLARLGHTSQVIPKSEWTAAALFGSGMKVEIDPDTEDIRVWIEEGTGGVES